MLRLVADAKVDRGPFQTRYNPDGRLVRVNGHYIPEEFQTLLTMRFNPNGIFYVIPGRTVGRPPREEHVGFVLPIRGAYSGNILTELDVKARGRHFWVYQLNIFSTTEELQPEQCFALLRARDSRIRRKIEDAEDLQNVGDAVGRGRRQVIPPATQREVWRRDGGRCVYCGSGERIEYDHIIPISRGGSNTVRNLQLLCERCNRRKGKTVGWSP